MRNVPKKILLIKDLTFILPDNFSGSFTEAIDEFIKHRKDVLKIPKLPDNDEDSTFKSLLLEDDNTLRACMIYVIFEIDESGEYKIIESSNNEVC